MRHSFSGPFLATAFILLTVSAASADDAIAVSVAIKDHKFTPSQITVPVGKPITLTIDNRDAQPEEFESHQLKVEKAIPGESKGMVRIGALKAGIYSFVGEFHEATAKGTMIVE